MDKSRKILNIKNNMKNVYEGNAKAFDIQRGKTLFEKNWLDQFIQFLPKNGSVLDVGCGTADPIATYFIHNGFEIVGLDFSDGMLDIAKKRFPSFKWLNHDMREFELGIQFDGIIAWNSFFHLDHEEQTKTLTSFSKHLKPSGVLMFTAGPGHGEVLGKVNGQDVYHSSFSFKEYKSILNSLKFSIINHKLEDPDCQGHSIYLAQLN